MKRALRLFAFTITSIFLLTSATAFAVPGNLSFVNGTPQALTVCQNASATSINAFLTTSDDQGGETLTWSVFLTPAHGTLSGFNATATSIVGNNTPSGLTYTPTAGYSGGDVIQIQVSNGINSAFTQINITVQAAPTPTFTTSPGASTCTSTSVTYTTQSGGGINSYTWSVPGVSGIDYTITSGGTGLANSTVTLTWLTTGSKTVTVNYKNLSGCLGITPASNTTTVNARPTPSFTSGPVATICGGVNTTYTTQAGQSSYVWSVPGTSGVDYNIVGGGIGSASNTVTLNWITSGSKTVTVNYNNAAGCNGVSAASNTTNVLTRPVATFTSAAGANTCVGSSVTYTTQTGGGINTYIWSVPGVSGTDYTVTSGGTGAGSNTVTLTWLTPGSKTVTVNYSDVNGCTSAGNATSTTTVNARPVPTFTSAATPLTCAGIGVTYTTQPGQPSYTWSVPGTPGTDYTITSGSLASNTVTISWITGGSKTVTVNYSDVNGCTGASAASNTTTVDAVIPTFTTAPGANICAGSSVTYTTQTGGGITNYVWSVPGTSGVDYVITAGGTGSGSNTVTLTWNTAGNQTVTVNYTDINGCTGINPASNTTNVHALPIPSFTTAPPVNSCVGVNITYTTQAGQSSYSWSVPGISGTDYNITAGGTGAASNTVTLNWITLGSKTVTVNYTDVNGCTSASAGSNTTTVNSLPTPTFTAAPGASTCAGTPVTYTTQTGGGITSYAWTVPGTAGIDYTITAGGIGSGSNTVTINWLSGGSKTVTVNYNNSAGCAGASPASNTTTVHAPAPTFTSVPATPACAGVNSTYTTQAGQASYAWTVPGVLGTDYTIAAGSTGPGSNTVTINWITTGSKTVTVNYTDGFGCTGINPASNTSSVNPSPAAISGPGSVCTGATITLSDGTAGGTWTSSTPALATVGSTTGIVTGYSVGSPTIFYTLPGGCAASVVVTVNQTPTGISGIFSSCTGGTTTLTNGYSGGVWTSASTGVATIGSNTGVVNAVAPGTSVITYTLPGGCTATVIYTVNVVPAAIGGASNVCVGQTTTLTDATSGGTWTSSATGVATIWSGAGIVNGISAGTTNITYTLGTGCFTTSPFTVNPVPAAITGTAVVCVGLSTTLSDATGGGTWSSSNPAQGSVVAGTGVVTGVAAGNPVISYTIGATGCFSTTTFTVNPNPAAIAGTATVCVGSTTTLSDATGGGSWTSGTPAQATVISSTGVVTGVATGNPVITYALPTGCLATIVATVNPLPATITGSLNVCPGTTTTLADASAGGTFTSNNIAVATIVGGTGVATGVSAGTSTITYTLPTGCFITAPLTVNPNPAAITGAAAICPGTSVTLADASGGGSFTSGNTAQATVVAATGVVTGVASGNPVITYTLPTGCLATVTETVNGSPLPVTFTAQGIISAVAGTTFGFSGDNGPAIAAQLANPLGVAVDANDNIYISTNGDNRVRKVSPLGVITTFAGTGASGFSGDGGQATAATFNGDVEGVAVDASGNVYIADAGNRRIRKVNTSGVISTFAGNGTSGFGGDGGQASAAQLTAPNGVAVDAAGNVYIADGGGRVRKVSTTGIITTYAGGGASLGDGGQATAAQLTTPNGVAVDAAGNVYVADYSADRIRKINTSGIITTVAGNGIDAATGNGGLATAASVAGPYGVAVDGAGNIYIAELDGSRARVINTAGIINALAGNGTDAVTGNGAPATAAQTAAPTGVAVGPYGNIYLAERDGNVVRLITQNPAICTGTTITLADATGGGTWSSSNPAVASVVSGTGVVTGVTVGLCTITYTAATGCTATISLRVSGTPVAITGTNNVCVAATTALADASAGGLWSSSNNTLATVGSATGIVTGVANGTLNVIYTTGVVYSMTGGCTAVLPFTVNPTPAVVTGSSTVCTGLTTTLADATGGGTFSSSNPSRATVVGATGVVTGVSAGALTITYTTSPGSCFAAFPFTVNATPPANTGSATVCTGATTTLANAISGGTWTSTNIAQATVGSSSGIVNGIAIGNPVISYTLATGCFANTTLTVNQAPAAITGATSVCTGATTTLSNTVGSGTWTSSNTARATVGSASGIVTGVSAGAVNITYTLGSCFVTYAFTVNQTPPAIVGSANICTGVNTTYSDGIAGGVWSSSNTLLATIGSSSGIATGSAPGTLNIIYTLPAGCFTTIPVTVNTQPAAITGVSSLCTGTTTTLGETTGGGAWSSSNSAIATVGTGTGIVSAVSAGTVTITYTMPGACIATFPMTINTTPAAITGTLVVCTTSNTTLSDATLGGVWTSSATAQATVGSSSGIVAGVTPGTSTITYTYPGGCTATAVVTVNATPTIFTVNGGGAYCSGTGGLHIGLSSSTSGINYQLFTAGSAVGASVAGTGLPLDFGSFTAGGVYTAVATNPTTGCTVSMSGSAGLSVNSLPFAYPVTGGGSYCSGSSSTLHIGLGASALFGVTYQLLNGGTAVGAALTGTGGVLDFGIISAAGTYTVQGTITATGCQTAMAGTAVISVNPLPPLHTVTVTGTGAYCAGGSGVHVGIDGSDAGFNYQLYIGGSTVGSTLPGTGAAIDFGLVTTPGSYTVLATNIATGCSVLMTGSATVTATPLPTIFAVTAPGGAGYCAGGAGVTIVLSGSVAGVNYQLLQGGVATGALVAGTGVGTLTMGTVTVGAVYTVKAINAAGCTALMSGSVTVSVNPLPTVFNVTGTGAYCTGGTGLHVGLDGSQIGVSYQLSNSVGPVGSAFTGTGLPIDFGIYVASTYTVTARNISTLCTNNMAGSAIISTNPLPNLYTMSASGSFCAGGTGFDVQLSGSDLAVTYQLYLGATAVGASVPGTSALIDFGLQTVGGTYTVKATNGAGCSVFMTGNTVVTVNPLPTVFAMNGGGSFCSGGTGVVVGLTGSTNLVTYQLYNSGAIVPGVVITGTGAGINFPLQTAGGSYTAIATSPSGCVNNMSGSSLITVNPLPTAYTVTGGGGYCAGTTGTRVGLGNSLIGINYQLYNASAPVGGPVAGAGAALDFGLVTAVGVYSVSATNATTGCQNGMAGTVTVSINPLPTAYTVSAVGGISSYCAGGTGINIQLSNSALLTTYQLYLGTIAVGSPVTGTGGVITFGFQTLAGTYTVVATTLATGCTANMTGSVTVTVNPLPVAYTVTGGGGYCAGGTGAAIGLSGSNTGISYQLSNGLPSGAAITGTGAPFTFGVRTAGTYTVTAMNIATTCTVNMLNSVTASINPLPAASLVSAAGSGHYCAGGTGVNILLASSVAGISYQLQLAGLSIGVPIPGSGAGLNFGPQTTAGVYTVLATNITTGCTAPMTGSGTVIIDAPPASYSVTGGGSFCPGGSGVSINLTGSDIGTTYKLYLGGSTLVTSVGGIGIPRSLYTATTPGVYTVIATNAAGCQATMTGSATVSLYPLPTLYTVAGGGSYCAGGSGVAVRLVGSDLGTRYQLFNDDTAIGANVLGTGAAINFGLQTAAGSYMVVATSPTTSCVDTMFDTAVIVINSLPVVQPISASGSYCPGGTGVAISLAGSQAGVNYQLFRGTTAVGSPVPGTTIALNFGLFTTPGIYTITGTNTTTLCSSRMSGADTVSVNALPAAYTVTGGGSYCAGDTGVLIGLGNSATGVVYQLYSGATAIGVPDTGTGAAISFGLHTAGGVYTVTATSLSTGCTGNMTGSATITINALPYAYHVTGGGGYCTGGTGVRIGLGGSTVGVSYQLMSGGAAVGSPVYGTGASLDFGLHSTPGNYLVKATNTATGCMSYMLDSVSVNINTLPTAYTVFGGSTGYCVGGTGVVIYIAGTDSGVNYQLYRGGSPIGISIAGTGSTALDFGPQTVPGTYTVVATNTATGCTSAMTGSATFVIYPLPPVNTVIGGGSYCAGGTGVTIGLAGSNAGLSYQLYDSVASGTPVTGTGAPVSFGLRTAAGTYTVVATNTSTGCSSRMTGSAPVVINPLPVNFAVTGGGAFCAGSTGVVINLSGSVTGTDYRLQTSGSPFGGVVSGTGLPVSFGPLTAAATYSVVATVTATGCSSTMTGSATVLVNALPAAFAVTGGGNFCPGGTGVHVGLYGSVTGINYQLYNGTSAMGRSMRGNGLPIDFGLQTATGTYTVVATDTATHCTSNMTGSVAVGLNPLPVAYNVVGGGSYCAGGSGVNIGLDGSNSGVAYQLFNGSLVGTAYGTGSVISFGTQSVTGTYTVVATNTATTCTNTMTGSATVSVSPVVIPSVSITTANGDTVCSTVAATFTAVATNGGSTPAYTWKVNGTVTSSDSAYTYIPANGDVVSVLLTSSAACAMPDTAGSTLTLVVIPQALPAIVISADPGNVVCRGTTVNYSASITDGGYAPAYSWKKNGVPVGTNSPAYTDVPVDGEVISCVLTSSYQCRLANSVLSNGITMEVDSPVTPNVTITASPSNYIVKGGLLTFTATINNAVVAPTYQWYLNGHFVAGATLPSYSDNVFVDLQDVKCVVTSGGGCGGLQGASNTITIHVSDVAVQQLNAGNMDVQLVPNPNKGVFTLKGSLGTQASEEVTVEITNMIGQVIYNGRIMAQNGVLDNKITLDGNLANGMYILSLHTDAENKVFHMVVEQ